MCFLYQSGIRLRWHTGFLRSLIPIVWKNVFHSAVILSVSFAADSLPGILTFLLRKEMSDNMVDLPDVPLLFFCYHLSIIQSSEGNLSTKCGASRVMTSHLGEIIPTSMWWFISVNWIHSWNICASLLAFRSNSNIFITIGFCIESRICLP